MTEFNEKPPRNDNRPKCFSAYNPGHDQWVVCPQIKQGYHRIILLTLTCDLFKTLCSS